MRQPQGNKKILNSKRFEQNRLEKNKWLRNLSMSEAIKLQEGIMSSEIPSQWHKNLSPDNPINVKRGLQRS